MLEQGANVTTDRATTFLLNETFEEGAPHSDQINISVSDQFAILNAFLKKTQFRVYIQMEEYYIRVLELVAMGENYVRLTIPLQDGKTRYILIHSMDMLVFSPKVVR